jgi:flagellar hook-associated protein 3 FlgL
MSLIGMVQPPSRDLLWLPRAFYAGAGALAGDISIGHPQGNLRVRPPGMFARSKGMGRLSPRSRTIGIPSGPDLKWGIFPVDTETGHQPEEIMRVSNQMLLRNTLRSVRVNVEALNRAQVDAATGRRVRTVSDDPIDASQIMRLNAQLRDIDQYLRNGATAKTRLSAEDAVLTSARDLMAQAKDAAFSGALDDPGDPLRAAALDQVQRLKDQIIALGNTKVGNEYIFAGALTDAPAFEADGTYAGDGTIRMAEIDAGLVVETNHTGDVLLGESLTALDDLIQELTSGDAASIRAAGSTLVAASDGLLAAQTDVGSRQGQIDDVETRIAEKVLKIEDRRTVLRDLDSAESVLRVVTAQTSLERAYAVVGRVLSTNIFQYLS